MNKTTVKLTEDLISFEKINVNPSNHPTSIYRVVLGLNKLWSKDDAQAIKQQILENQNFVNVHPDYTNIQIKYLKELQEKAEKFDLLQNGYKEYNEKHFGELCDNLLDVDDIKELE